MVNLASHQIKKVSAEQMDMLFEFTRKHYVEYYDVQCELVDHLANSIEERWQTQPDLGFNEALHFEFKKFGIFGFTGIVEQRQGALTKKYEKLTWAYLKEYVRLPKIVLTLLLIVLAYKLGRFNMIAYSVLLSGVVMLGIVMLIILNVKYRRKVKKTGKKWLYETLIMRSTGFMVAPYQILYHVYRENPSALLMWIMSALFIVFTLYTYITLYLIPSKAEEHLLKTYPEYNM